MYILLKLIKQYVIIKVNLWGDLMTLFYNIKDITLGSPTYSGHIVYPNAIVKNGKSERIIFKRNKKAMVRLSRLEVAFTQIAKLFLNKNLTSNQRLVINDAHKILGVGSQHLCYVIAKKEGLTQSFFTLKNPLINTQCQAFRPKQVEDIPLYFFDKLPQGFFNQLIRAQQSNSLSIDYSSLASILTSSYTLEEDDLHKGNFGFYLIEHAGKPRVVFFKIDHDLMFVESILSYRHFRPFHLANDEHAFDICAEDLLNFPNIKKSANFYWPTKLSYFFTPSNNRKFQSEVEVEAFIALKETPEFKKAKWLCFYKHILLPQELLQAALKQSYDVVNPVDRADCALMMQAVIARQACLRETLFSIKEFRDFLTHLNQKEQNDLLEEVIHTAVLDDRKHISNQIKLEMEKHRHLCHEIDAGDTPLHVAIKLKNYRYEETIQKYGHFINTKNKRGLTPLDVAVRMARTAPSSPKDVCQDVRFIMKHLLKNGAHKTAAFNVFNRFEHIESYQFHTDYLNKARQARTYDQIKEILRAIGEDHSFCLKFKKNLSIECIKQFIKMNQTSLQLNPILVALKKDINGQSPETHCAYVRYIRQLRSRLWIIRQIRGLFGWTSTQAEVNRLINGALDRVQTKGFMGASHLLTVEFQQSCKAARIKCGG